MISNSEGKKERKKEGSNCYLRYFLMAVLSFSVRSGCHTSKRSTTLSPCPRCITSCSNESSNTIHCVVCEAKRERNILCVMCVVSVCVCVREREEHGLVIWWRPCSGSWAQWWHELLPKEEEEEKNNGYNTFPCCQVRVSASTLMKQFWGTSRPRWQRSFTFAGPQWGVMCVPAFSTEKYA